MPSDLATALISGNNAGAMSDPAMAAIAPQLQLAQALSSQGMSTAPASPWQAAGRLAQALAGVKIQGDAINDLNTASTGSTSEMGKIFPEGTPIGDGIRSQSGLVRMMAMQQAGKAMLLNSESKKLGPTDVIAAPGTPRAGGGIVATGVPEMAGAVETAKNPALIARAAGEAAGKAPFEGGGEATVPGGPSGSQTIPITAATRAAMQPHPVPTQSFTRPDASAAPMAPNKVQDSVPAGTPGAAPGGKPVETPEYKGNIAGAEKLQGAASEAIGKVIAEHIEAGGKASRDKLNALDTMESALRNGGKGVFTGPHSESVLKVKQTLDALGAQSDWVKQGLPESEIVGKMNAQLSSASAKAMTGRPTQAEFLIWQRNNPGLMTSKEGSLALMDVIRQQTKQDIELGKLAQNKKNWENWPETVDKFYETHGLTNPLTGKPMKDEIAAAHGGAAVSGGAKPATLPAGAPEGTKQAPDGHFYAPDPGRPGKFLRVDH